MAGTIFALLAGSALIVLAWRFRPSAVERPSQDASGPFLTSEQLEKRLEGFQKDADWMLNEWHEKFSTLHARLTKRVQRSQGPPEREPRPNGPSAEPLPSVLHYRKPWSV